MLGPSHERGLTGEQHERRRRRERAGFEALQHDPPRLHLQELEERAFDSVVGNPCGAVQAAELPANPETRPRPRSNANSDTSVSSTTVA